MAESLIAADLDLPLDVLCNIAAEVTFNRVIGVDELTDAEYLCIGEIANFGVVVDVESVEGLM